MNPAQCAILVGGMGTRLGEAVKGIPKPMLDIAGVPFLTRQIREIARFGFTRFLLLSGYCADVVEEYFARVDVAIPPGVSVSVLRENEPLGTGGALRAAREHLESEFLLCNGDSLCLFNLLGLFAPLKRSSLARMALMKVDHNSRYGQVTVSAGKVQGFAERAVHAAPGLMNAGMYYMRRNLLDVVPTGKSSLEKDVFPLLAAAGALEAHLASPEFFIDIGIPEDLEKAQVAIPAALTRPAVFFDRDGVLNHDYGHVHDVKNFHWVEGAKESVLACNEAGYFVFVVTNQAGIAKGLYGEEQMHFLHERMQRELREIGAHVDAFTFCPHHPEAVIPELKRHCACRKPEPGMLLQLLDAWPIDRKASFMIGDKASDMAAAAGAGVQGRLFSGGDVSSLVLPLLRTSKDRITP